MSRTEDGPHPLRILISYDGAEEVWTAYRRPPTVPGETSARLADLARELEHMSRRLREAARRIEDLVRAMATLEHLADAGPEALLDSLERLGLSGEETQAALALLSLLAEGPDEGEPDDSRGDPSA